jgi:DNA-binding NtrC family response regulator
LKNAVERALVFAKSAELTPPDLPDAVRAAAGAGAAAGDGLASLEDLEREAIRRTLEATRFKIGRSAGILGISRKTLLEKRKKYGLG